MSTPGFYGKLAGRGDFIHRGLAPEFIAAWDGWLAAGIAASQGELGERWLDAYLVSPLWRFALAPGVLGSDAMVGVMMPSIDRVGRYFPLTIVLSLPAQADLGGLVTGSNEWFERAESLLLSTLDEGADFEVFEAAVRELGAPDHARLGQIHADADGHLRFFAGSADERATALRHLACEGSSLWWGAGSERVAPCLKRYYGMPPAHSFSRFLGEGALSPQELS